MSKVQPEVAIARKINDVEDICFDHCVQSVTAKPFKVQELCMENCFKKVLSALDFMARFDKLGGVDRK